MEEKADFSVRSYLRMVPNIYRKHRVVFQHLKLTIQLFWIDDIMI